MTEHEIEIEIEVLLAWRVFIIWIELISGNPLNDLLLLLHHRSSSMFSMCESPFSTIPCISALLDREEVGGCLM